MKLTKTNISKHKKVLWIHNEGGSGDKRGLKMLNLTLRT